jgi:transcriptional regulator with XRE-family HTH domain
MAMNIGKKIRNAREDMDLSQNDMATLIPMNQSNYSKIERDIQEPSLEQLRRICQILNIDPRYLLELNDIRDITEDDLRLLRDIKRYLKNYSSKK